MTLLTTITNEAVNDNLQKRWTNGEIYTYIGAVLISVNPFRGMPKGYRVTRIPYE
jgi:myosin-1